MADAGKRGETTEPKKSGPTKAQSEMDRFRARRTSDFGSMAASASQPFAGPVQWAYVAPPPGAGHGWPLPPSVVQMGPPPGLGGPSFPGGAAPGLQAAADTVGGRLGSTLGLGVDVLNAVLAGSIGLLQRFSAGYGYASPAGGCGCGGSCGCGGGHGGGCGCGGGCGDPCMTGCGYDCCCAVGCDTCCNPSVGNCC